MNADALIDELFSSVIREALIETLEQPETKEMADKIFEVVKGKAGLAGVVALALVLNESLHQAPKLIQRSLRSLVGKLMTEPNFDEAQEKEKEVDADYFHHDGSVYVKPVSIEAHDYFNSGRFGESSQFPGTYGFPGESLPDVGWEFSFREVPVPHKNEEESTAA